MKISNVLAEKRKADGCVRGWGYVCVNGGS